MLLFKVTGKTSISCPVKCYSITKGSKLTFINLNFVFSVSRGKDQESRQMKGTI